MIKQELKSRIMVLEARINYNLEAISELGKLDMTSTKAYTILDISLQHMYKQKRDLKSLLEIE